MRVSSRFLGVLLVVSTSTAVGYDGYDPYSPDSSVDRELGAKIADGLHQTSLAIGEKLFFSEDPVELGCSQPVGSAVYSHPATVAPGIFRKGLRETISGLTVQGHVLHAITESGEYIDYPFANPAVAKTAAQQLCKDPSAFLDLSQCDTEEERRLVQLDCHGSALGLSTGAGLSQLLETASRNDQTVSAHTLQYSCSRKRLFPTHLASAASPVAGWVPLHRLERMEHYDLFARGIAKAQALRDFYSQGIATESLVKISVFGCSEPRESP